MACTFRPINCDEKDPLEILLRRCLVVLVDEGGEPILDANGEKQYALRIVNECDVVAS